MEEQKTTIDNGRKTYQDSRDNAKAYARAAADAAKKSAEKSAEAATAADDAAKKSDLIVAAAEAMLAGAKMAEADEDIIYNAKAYAHAADAAKDAAARAAFDARTAVRSAAKADEAAAAVNNSPIK